MAKGHASQAVSWLLHEGGETVAVPVSSYMTFEDEHWRATIERVDIGDALRVHLTKAEVRRGLSIEPAQSVPGTWLCSMVAVKGRTAVSFADGAHFRLTPARSVMLRPQGGSARFTPAPRQTLRVSGYMMREDRIASLCEGEVPERLKPLLEPEPDRSHVIGVPVTAHLKRVATRMLSEEITGVLRLAYLEGLALQLFAIQNSLSASATRALTAVERDAVQEARERLLVDMRKPPTAAELAAAVGMSERRLSAGFKEMFGATIFEALRNERLEHARLVLEKEALPLKIVADRVGYRHVTNFISAFTARYGDPPREFARCRAAPARRGRRGRAVAL